MARAGGSAKDRRRALREALRHGRDTVSAVPAEHVQERNLLVRISPIEFPSTWGTPAAGNLSYVRARKAWELAVRMLTTRTLRASYIFPALSPDWYLVPVDYWEGLAPVELRVGDGAGTYPAPFHDAKHGPYRPSVDGATFIPTVLSLKAILEEIRSEIAKARTAFLSDRKVQYEVEQSVLSSIKNAPATVLGVGPRSRESDTRIADQMLIEWEIRVADTGDGYELTSVTAAAVYWHIHGLDNERVGSHTWRTELAGQLKRINQHGFAYRAGP